MPVLLSDMNLIMQQYSALIASDTSKRTKIENSGENIESQFNVITLIELHSTNHWLAVVSLIITISVK